MVTLINSESGAFEVNISSFAEPGVHFSFCPLVMDGVEAVTVLT